MTVMEAKSRGRATPANAKQVEVKITTTGDPNEPYDLQWKKSFFGVQYWGKPPIGTKMGSSACLTFELHDHANTGVQFQTPVTAAFGANAVAGACPGAGSDGGGEIDFANSSATGTELSIIDSNLAAGDLQFAVFFNDGSKLDPIIKNTGGGTRLSD
jgi:hypothetical protein